jgi:hypothetical protein
MTCVLAVRDDELGVRDDEDASSSAAEGGPLITWMGIEWRAGSVCPGREWLRDCTCEEVSYVIPIFIIIFVFYSLKQIE